MLIAVVSYYYPLIASYYPLIVSYYLLIVGNDPLPMSVTHGSSVGHYHLAYYYIDAQKCIHLEAGMLINLPTSLVLLEVSTAHVSTEHGLNYLTMPYNIRFLLCIELYAS